MCDFHSFIITVKITVNSVLYNVVAEILVSDLCTEAKVYDFCGSLSH